MIRNYGFFSRNVIILNKNLFGTEIYWDIIGTFETLIHEIFITKRPHTSRSIFEHPVHYRGKERALSTVFLKHRLNL